MAGYKDLNDFITHVRTIGLPTASHFQILLPSMTSAKSDEIAMLCDDIQMPGFSLMTNEVRTMGEVSEMVYGIAYPPINLNIILNNNFDAKAYFDEWANQVYNRANRTVGYYKEYAKEVTIEALDKSGKTIYSITLIEAFPKMLADISFSNASHEVLKLNVQLIYRYWKKTGEIETGIETAVSNVIPGSSRMTLDNFLNFPNSMNPMSSPFESLSKSASPLSFDFVSKNGPLTDIGSKLSSFGPAMGGDLNRSCKNVTANSLGFEIPGVTGFGSSFGSSISSIGSSINSVGGAIGSIGRSIRNVTAPLAAIGGTVNSLSNSIGALDSVLSSVGIKNTGLRSITKDLNKIGGSMGKLSTLNGFPGKLGSLGGSMSALGGSFHTIKKSFDKFPSASADLKNSIGKLGDTFSKKGNETSDAAGEMKSQIDNGVLNA